MDYVALGTSGIRKSRFALGTGQLGLDQGAIDVRVAHAVVECHLEAGCNLIDTAEAYQGGKSEQLLGDILRERRDDIVPVSKFGRSTTPHPSRCNSTS